VLDSITFVQVNSYFSGAAILEILERVPSDYLLLILTSKLVGLSHQAMERLLRVAEDSGAGIVYSDFLEHRHGLSKEHRLIDYQTGSLRDDFDFGALLVVSMKAAWHALRKYGAIDHAVKWGGLYDLRLRISAEFPLLHVPETLYEWFDSSPVGSEQRGRSKAGEEIFKYVEPENRDYQREMERIATEHLKRIGAYLGPEFSSVPPPDTSYPLLASIVIPVRNRVRTIADALRSALGQRASFDYNVIVVNNHSTDGTTEVLNRIAREHNNLIHKIPKRTDLGIGGCWNEAIYSPECGLFAVQHDSDDLYADDETLERIIGTFFASEDSSTTRASLQERPHLMASHCEPPRYAMVIGSYITVDFNLKEIPPGLVDHREWTRENGRNNALRVSGFGAPRAYYVPLLRQIGFPNVSYGEDYAVCLQLSRDYEVGRIFDPIYLVRRWEDNTDRELPLEVMNQYDAYKDWLRTVEIAARQKRNARS